MSVRRPDIFISATSADLRSCRQLVKEALLTLGCVPVEQGNFPPDYRSVREMLRARIAACDAVVHLAGACYGAEPREREVHQPRRSYTQMEYDLARELRKPLYIFICGDNFPYDEYAAEDAAKQELQQAHRAALGASETLRTRIHSRDELGQRVRELQTQVDKLARELSTTRRWLTRAVWAGFTVALALGATLWTVREQNRYDELNDTKVGRQIEMLADVVNQFTATNTGATKEELFDRALATIAADMRVDTAELRTAIEGFVRRVRDNPRASFIDKARADFAEQRFAAAAQNAAQAADEFRRESVAAEREVAVSVERLEAARAKEREMRTLAGDAHLAGDQFAEAQTMFTRALALAPREREPTTWASLQLRLAQCAWRLASEEAGTAVAAHIANGEAACRAALTVYTRGQFPSDWAIAQKHLGNILQLKAGASDGGASRGTFLAAAVTSYRAALEVHTPESNLEEWAYTENNLAIALYNQAFATTGPGQLQLLKEAETVCRTAIARIAWEKTPRAWGLLHTNLGQNLAAQALQATGAAQEEMQREAITAYETALTVFPRATRAGDWGRVQNHLASLQLAQAQARTGAARAQALTQATDTFHAVLDVYTREGAPQRWATTQFNIGYAQSLLADIGSPEEQRAWLDATIASYRRVLEVYTRETIPQAWAWTHLNLGYALQRRAYFAIGAERTDLQAAAADSIRHALEIFTAENLPSQWGTTQLMLATLLQAQAEASPADSRAPLLREGAASCRAALTVFTRDETPQPWGTAQITLAALLQAESEIVTGAGRAALLDEAAAIARRALTVFPRNGPPGTWGFAMNTLAVILRHQAGLEDHPDRVARAVEAVSAAREVLAEFSSMTGTLSFATTQGNLADALLVQADTLTGAARTAALEEAVPLFRQALQLITPSIAPEEHDRLRASLARAETALAP